MKYNDKGFFAHKDADIEDGAKVGKGTKIWAGSHLMPGARIGSNCNIGQNVFVGAKAVIGNGVKIQNNVSVYDDVIVEDDCFLGPSMVFTNVINPRAFIERKDEYKKTLVEKGVSVGANATIVCGVTLGKYSFVGAGSVVTKDIAPYRLVYGNPARNRGFICRCGMKLSFKGKEAVCECGQKYQKTSDGEIFSEK
ncbi:MAG: acyltransferase [Elusimicrobia bacterium]|jgi:UDP-2-acetamido-3-amino-2,3-dideoxy-glucuronate N-acetyltransferase|nr:acyltransferase [Elusimicrobiota bacterium]